MTVILIHSARVAGHGKLEPVGVWAVTDDGHRCVYAAGREQYEERGWAALLNQPNVPPIEWAYFQAHRSPNWRIHASTSLFVDDAEHLPEILGSVRAEFFAHLAAKTEAARRSGDVLEKQPSPHAPAEGARTNALSWWIAGELVRRHPELLAYETHPGGGMYDVLNVGHPRESSSGSVVAGACVMMNRVGSVHLRDADGRERSIPWKQVDRDRFAAAAHLEGVLGYAPTSPASATTRSLAYRFLAAALGLLATDARWWDVRSEFLDTADWPADDPGHIRAFPSAMAERDLVPPLGIYGEPLSHFFTLWRDDEPIAMVSIEGRLHKAKGAAIDLLPAYEKHDRRIRWMTASLLRDWL